MSNPLDAQAAAVASDASPGEQMIGAARPLAWRDIRGTVRRHADELLNTEAEAASLEALRAATGETDGDMERHTVRQYLIAERIAETHGIPYDRELLLCASFLHDSGLYDPATGFWPATLEITCTHWRRMLPGMFRPPGPRESMT